LSTRSDGHASIDSDSEAHLATLVTVIVVSIGAWRTHAHTQVPSAPCRGWNEGMAVKCRKEMTKEIRGRTCLMPCELMDFKWCQ
jgi:hypothetical protein